jgi:hypothetical protein
MGSISRTRRLIPNGFLTIREAAEKVAVAMYAGVPDRPVVTAQKQLDNDVADGAAIEDAISNIWTAVDGEKLQAFAVGGKHQSPLKLSADLSKEIPALRSPRGGDFSFLRSSNRHHRQFQEWFGPNMTDISVVFREIEITRLARTLLRARRRKAASAGKKKVGRPTHKIEIERIIRELIDAQKWAPTKSLKALTSAVNSKGKWLDPVSDDTVRRAIDGLYKQTGDRRFQRPRREK